MIVSGPRTLSVRHRGLVNRHRLLGRLLCLVLLRHALTPVRRFLVDKIREAETLQLRLHGGLSAACQVQVMQRSGDRPPQ
jgi:hypothetical protein